MGFYILYGIMVIKILNGGFLMYYCKDIITVAYEQYIQIYTNTHMSNPRTSIHKLNGSCNYIYRHYF